MGKLDEGIGSYVRTRGRLALQLLTKSSEARKIRRPNYSWDEIIDYSFHFADGFLSPLQVRSEIKQALETIERLQPATIMEIGTATGGTFFMLARAARPDAHLVSVDLPGGACGGGYSAWKPPVFRRLLVSGQTADFLRGDSHSPKTLEAVKRTLRGAPVDVLFIDGDHSYEGVKQDFETYSRLVRPDGLIFFHDVVEHPPASNCWVSRFWNELRVTSNAQEFIENPRQGWGGIGMVRAEGSVAR